MGFELGQEIIDRLRFKKRSYGRSKTAKHLIYGKVYYPNYNLDFMFNPGSSKLYNEYGEKLKEFFLRDIMYAHSPYRQSRYFVWDRYNFGLDTHFYSHKCMLETMGNPKKRYGLLMESEAIMRSAYRIFDTHKGLEKDFDLIFTHSAQILDKIDNARFVPFCATIWNADSLSDDAYKRKTKNVSILSSDKLMCEMHKFRYDLAHKCKREGLADTFGTFDGGPFVKIADTLTDYRYSICIENEVQPYFFTERLTSALAAQTVPIYLGASKIDEFFNPDGIIKITTKDDIKEVLKQCTKEEYERRLPAILDNYERAIKYRNPFDFMYEKYLKEENDD